MFNPLFQTDIAWWFSRNALKLIIEGSQEPNFYSWKKSIDWKCKIISNWLTIIQKPNGEKSLDWRTKSKWATATKLIRLNNFLREISQYTSLFKNTRNDRKQRQIVFETFAFISEHEQFSRNNRHKICSLFCYKILKQHSMRIYII